MRLGKREELLFVKGTPLARVKSYTGDENIHGGLSRGRGAGVELYLEKSSGFRLTTVLFGLKS